MRRKRKITSVQETFKNFPIVHDTTLLSEILQIGISSFGAHQLGREVRKAELSRFCAGNELEIEHKEDDRDTATLKSSGNKRYAYSTVPSSTSTGNSRTRAPVILKSDGKININATFVCMYWNRMILLCRQSHAIALEIYKDKLKSAWVDCVRSSR